MNREQVSVTVITLNEEKNIRECLESVKWADEIIVVDSGSSDRTVEIAKEYTDKVFRNPWPGMNAQKVFAAGQSTRGWILNIDADERASADMKDFIMKELEHPLFDGYRFPRKNHFLGRWLKHGGWYPDHVLRLFRRDRGRYAGSDPHDKVVVDSGNVMTAPAHLIHYTYDSLAQFETKIQSYTTASARVRYVPGKRNLFLPFLTPIKAVTKFFEVYIIKRSFLDGYLGLVLALATASSAFWKLAKLWELQDREKQNRT